MPIVRQTPLKQNIRLWFDFLKVALNTKTLTIKQKEINVVVNKEYYRSWDLPQVRKLSFDKWWKTHSHLFAHKEFVNVRVLNELSLNDAMKEVRKQLIDKVDQKSSFHITSKKFRYKEVDDYLKCWKLRQTKVFNRQKKEYLPMQYNDIAIKIAKSYRKKTKSKKVVRRTFGVGIAESYFDRKVLHSVKKRVNNAKMIILNTAKGSFTGQY
mgnify:CR=1 FL=1